MCYTQEYLNTRLTSHEIDTTATKNELHKIENESGCSQLSGKMTNKEFAGYQKVKTFSKS